jgi:hypothetical protein
MTQSFFLSVLTLLLWCTGIEVNAQNPGFEDNQTGWSNNGVGSRTILTSAGNFRSGARGLQITTTSTSDSKLFASGFTVTVPASGTNYVTVMAYVKGAAPAEVTVGMYDNTLAVETKSSTTYTPGGTFTLIETTFPATNGSVYYPYLYCRSTTGASASAIFDDVIIYTSTQATTDLTAPAAPNTFTIGVSGTSITLGFINGTDAQSGIDGVLILRRSAGAIPTAQTATGQVWYSTNSLIGPTVAGTFTVVYNGPAVSSYTDNPGATGIYTYYVYMRDKAYNYTASSSSARVFVFNGTSLASSVANNCAIDGIFLPATCTLTLQSSSTVTVRAGSVITIFGTVVMQGNLNNNQGAAALTFANGSLYRYARNGGGTFSVTTATWSTGSVCRVDGITTAAPPGGLAQQFASFEWNCASQVAAGAVTLPNNFRCTQNCSIINTGVSGSVTFSGYNTIGGNLSQSAGTSVSFAVGNTIEMNGSAAQSIDVAGPMEGITINHTGAGVSLLRSVQFNDTLNLLLGQMNAASFTLTAGNGAAISRTAGTVAAAPAFAGNNDIIYRAAVTTGAELPVSVSVMRNLSLRLPVNGTVTLNASASVNGNLDLVRGWLLTTTANLLTLADNATSSGASNNSFVNGPLLKTGNDAFVFPVGKNTYYASIAISAPANAGSEFSAEYFQTDPDPFYNTLLLDATLAGVSRCEYWMLDRLAGTDAVSVTLSWDTTECGPGYVATPADLVVARWDGALWRDHGNGGTTGGIQTGTVVSAGPVSSFSPFTLGSSTLLNPLPVELLSFTAVPEGSNVKTAWQTATETNSDYFIIERSADGAAWEFVARREAAGFSTQVRNYEAFDLMPLPGVSYYRLRQTDINGTEHIYPPVAVNFEPGTAVNAFVQGNELMLAFAPSANPAQAEITVNDAAGRVCIQQKVTASGVQQFLLPDAPGVYFVTIVCGDVIVHQPVMRAQ